MVVFPALANESTLLNEPSRSDDEQPVLPAASSVEIHVHGPPAVTTNEAAIMSPGKESIALTLDAAELPQTTPAVVLEKTKLDLPTADTMQAEPAIVKKIAGKAETPITYYPCMHRVYLPSARGAGVA